MNGESRIVDFLENDIKNELDRIGLLYRIFARVKSDKDVLEKINRKGYTLENNKKVQDYIGIRITLYFFDDLELVTAIVKHKYTLDNEENDVQEPEVFKPVRKNFVMKIPTNLLVGAKALSRDPFIDSTFEVQIRTVLAEGWHEVEHDMRYKNREGWLGQDDLSRSLNGISATLENSDLAMLKIFDELSYRNYKLKNWEQMLRNKFRLRFQSDKLTLELKNILDSDLELSKQLFKLSRKKHLLKLLEETKISYPITVNNLFYLINLLEIKNDLIKSLTPLPMIEKLR